MSVKAAQQGHLAQGLVSPHKPSAKTVPVAHSVRVLASPIRPSAPHAMRGITVWAGGPRSRLVEQVPTTLIKIQSAAVRVAHAMLDITVGSRQQHQPRVFRGNIIQQRGAPQLQLVQPVMGCCLPIRFTATWMVCHHQ